MSGGSAWLSRHFGRRHFAVVTGHDDHLHLDVSPWRWVDL